MNNRVKTYLVCPICKRTFSKVTGYSLTCRFCKKTYKVNHGIPILVDLESLSAHLVHQIRYFKDEVTTYGGTYSSEEWQRKFVELFFNRIHALKGKVIVDDACGSGYMSIEAARRDATVIACDLNMSGLLRLSRVAKQLGLSEKIIIVCCSSEALPIRSGCADGLVANAILEHLPREKDAIHDISRVAKKGAIAMITVPIAYYLLNPLFLPINYIHDRKIGHLRRYTKEMLVARFSGWKLLKAYYSGHTYKVVKTLVNIIIRIFDEHEMEEYDEKSSGNKLFSSNISVLFKKS